MLVKVYCPKKKHNEVVLSPQEHNEALILSRLGFRYQHGPQHFISPSGHVCESLEEAFSIAQHLFH